MRRAQCSYAATGLDFHPLEAVGYPQTGNYFVTGWHAVTQPRRILRTDGAYLSLRATDRALFPRDA